MKFTKRIIVMTFLAVTAAVSTGLLTIMYPITMRTILTM